MISFRVQHLTIQLETEWQTISIWPSQDQAVHDAEQRQAADPGVELRVVNRVGAVVWEWMGD